MSETHAVYFSCRTHLEFVYMSLVSLLRQGVCGPKYVIGDPGDPFEAGDILRLKGLSPAIVVTNSSIPVERHGSSGLRAIASEVSWYRSILRAASSTDYVVKLDSDTLIVGRRVFELLAGASPGVVGSPIHLDGVTFSRGACYFLRKDVVEALFQITSASDFESNISCHLGGDSRVMAPESYGHPYPEDRVIHTLITRLTSHSPTLIDYVFDVEESLQDWDGSYDVLHFPGTAKAMMPSVFSRLTTKRI